MDDDTASSCACVRLHRPAAAPGSCACTCHESTVRRCYACWRDLDRDPWPYEGQLCGHCDDYPNPAA